MTRGRVGGVGFRLDGSECYLNLMYAVGGRTYKIDSPHTPQWCGYRHGDHIPVHYRADNPDVATLTPRGPTPTLLLTSGAAIVGGVASLGYRRRRERSRLDRG